MKSSSTSLAVVTAVNDDDVLATNLAKSPMFEEGGIPLVIERAQKSASLAYNAGFDHSDADVVIFAHQDVYFPRGWDGKLLSTIKTLESSGKNWAVLGIVGKDRFGNLVGGAWSTGLGVEIKSEFTSPAPVRTIDEVAIVLRREAGLRFDEELPGYHLYGTDIVQTAIRRDLEAYVFDGPVIHNSIPVVQLDGSYSKAYRYMQRKWKLELPILTTVVPITKSGWPLLRKRISHMRKNIIKGFPARRQYTRHVAPARIAQDLGYECTK